MPSVRVAYLERRKRVRVAVVRGPRPRVYSRPRRAVIFESGARGHNLISGGTMSEKNTAIFGVYPTPESADAAVDTLRTKGFRSTDVSVLFPQNLGSKEFGHEKGTKS